MDRSVPAEWVRVRGWSGCLQAWPHPQCQDREALFEALQILHRRTFQFPAWSRGAQMSTFGDKVRKQQRAPLKMNTFISSDYCEPHTPATSTVSMLLNLKCLKRIFFSRKEASHLLWEAMHETKNPSTLYIDETSVLSPAWPPTSTALVF